MSYLISSVFAASPVSFVPDLYFFSFLPPIFANGILPWLEVALMIWQWFLRLGKPALNTWISFTNCSGRIAALPSIFTATLSSSVSAAFPCKANFTAALNSLTAPVDLLSFCFFCLPRSSRSSSSSASLTASNFCNFLFSAKASSALSASLLSRYPLISSVFCTISSLNSCTVMWLLLVIFVCDFQKSRFFSQLFQPFLFFGICFHTFKASTVNL